MTEIGTALRVLIIEDSEADAELLLAELLQSGRRIAHRVVDNPKAVLDALKEKEGWDIVLADYKMPEFDGLDALSLVKKSGLSAPFILISGVIGEEKAIDALHSGASDYILKTNLKRLIPAVNRCIAGHRLRKERDLARDALAESDRRFLQLVDGLKGYALLTLDTDGKIVSWNAGAEGLFGYRVDEILGQSYAIFFSPDDVAMEKTFLDLQLAGQAGYYEEEDWRYRKDGNRFWAHSILSASSGKGGDMKGFFVVVHDISEQRKSSEMLKESETKFRSLVNRIPDAVWTANARGDFQYFSSNVEDLTGFTADEIVAKDYRFWRERIHPEDQEEYQMAWVRFFRDRKPFAMEFRFQKRSGEWTWMLARAEALYERGEQTLADGLLDDISDRKITEQRIREQARLLDLAQDAIVVRDLNRRILYWNHGAEVMFGWPASDVLEKDMTEQIFRNMDALVAAEKILLEKDEWNGELHCFAKSGKEVIVSSRWTLVKNEEGKPASILSINTNITEKRRLESQFLRAQRMESIGTMAGGVAHDLNNILAPIMMSAPLLRQDSLPASEREALLNTIESNSERGGDLIRQLLMFGRGIEGEKSVVQVKFLIREMVKIARETFPRNMSVSEEVDNDLWPVLGDATHIHQILLNLCVNARDAMPDGGKLKVAAGNQLLDEHYSALDSELKSGPYITIKVSDSGHGISPADLEKIFDPFFTTKDVGKGTGLGLSTVMGIVKGMGGIIHVYSERGKGTSFNVFLPAEPTAKEDAGTERKALAMGHGETILVVDDEDGILQATCKLLTKHGYQSLPASDGAEALSVFSRNRESINAVLTDVMMPVMDGLDLVRVIRKMDPVMKVVASSGLEDDSKFEALKNLGVSTFLAKPYTAEKLLTTLRNILDE